MDLGDHLRPGQQQQVVVALQVVALRRVVAARAVHVPGLRVVALGEALAAIVGFLQPMALDHRAHRAIDDQDALGEGLQQFLRALRVQPGQAREWGLGIGDW